MGDDDLEALRIVVTLTTHEDADGGQLADMAAVAALLISTEKTGEVHNLPSPSSIPYVQYLSLRLRYL